jgi:hypothetical protein
MHTKSFALLSLFFISRFISAQDIYVCKEQAGMVASERAFSAATVQLGVEEGFLTFFSNDAISFEAELKSAREKLLKQKPSEHPITTALLWTPESGDIAKSMDFGYLYGPWQYATVSTGFISARGKYISIWKKDSLGLWQVAFDCGIETRDKDVELPRVTFVSHSDSAEFASRKVVNGADAKISLMKAEMLFSKLNGDHGTAADDTILSNKLVLFRDGIIPLTEKDETTAWYANIKSSSFRIAGIEIASSNDMAYIYGTCGRNMETFYYLHIWKTNASGEWKLVVDVCSKK